MNFGGDTIQPIVGRKQEEKGGSDKKITQSLLLEYWMYEFYTQQVQNWTYHHLLLLPNPLSFLCFLFQEGPSSSKQSQSQKPGIILDSLLQLIPITLLKP